MMWLETLSTILFIFFSVGFVALGFAFIRKTRKERRQLLTVEIEKIQKEFDPLAQALAPTRHGWFDRIAQIYADKKESSKELFEELEAVLLSADVGVKTSDRLLDEVKKASVKGELHDLDSIKTALKTSVKEILSKTQAPLEPEPAGAPRVMMFVGVNGVGKTTTIGKMAEQFREQGKTVLLGAGDTFRAAAVEQLSVWATRTGALLVRGNEQADPASVLFEAVQKAKSDSVDVVLCDTAGRLHTKTNLMEELKKVHRVIQKALPGAPHEVFLVLDATTGQNALLQAKQFTEATPLTGIILTKLDGTAKGGVLIGLVNELGVPVRYIGIGESAKDLKPFDADAFVDALFA